MVTINGVVGGVQADARHASTGVPEPSVSQAPKERQTMPNAAFVHPMANLDRLIAHVAGSAVEAGLGAVPLAVRPGHVTARLPLTERTRTPDGRASQFALGMFADLGIGI